MCRYGVWDSCDRYGFEVQCFWYRYSDMMNYDNSIFNISVMIFSTLVFRYKDFWAILGDIIMYNLRYRVGGRYSINIWILPRDYDMGNDNFWWSQLYWNWTSTRPLWVASSITSLILSKTIKPLALHTLHYFSILATIWWEFETQKYVRVEYQSDRNIKTLYLHSMIVKL